MRHLTDINLIIADLKDEISDLEWEGEFEEADMRKKELQLYLKMRDDGEKYVPDF